MDASATVDQENMEVGREKQRFYLRSHSERILFSIQSLVSTSAALRSLEESSDILKNTQKESTTGKGR